jgi:hypothetical protein
MSATLDEAWLCPNRILAKLADEQLAPLCSLLKRVHARTKEVWHHQPAPVQYVYFPNTATLPNLLLLQDGLAIEIGTFGNEGFSAAWLLAGAVIILPFAMQCS